MVAVRLFTAAALLVVCCAPVRGVVVGVVRYDETEAILGPKYVQLLRAHSPVMTWDDEAQEHFFVYKKAGVST